MEAVKEVKEYLLNAAENGYNIDMMSASELACDIVAYTDTQLSPKEIADIIRSIRADVEFR